MVEKPTGTLQLGAGFSSAEKVSFNFGIAQENVFGSGNYLGLQVNTSKYNRTISLTTHRSVLHARRHLAHLQHLPHDYAAVLRSVDGDYKLVNEGGSIRFGVPFSEVDTVFFGVGRGALQLRPRHQHRLRRRRRPIATTSAAPPAPTASSPAVPNDTRLGHSAHRGLGARRPRQRAGADRGRLQRANLEIGVGGDMKYFKSSYQYQQFFPLSKQYTFAFNGEVGYGKAYGDKVYPIFKNFYAGGLGSVRGFEQNSLGPRDVPGQTEGAALGGTKKAIFNAELSTPFPGAGNDRTLRLYGFFDVGNVFADRASAARPTPNGRRRRSCVLRSAWASAGSRRWARCAWPTPCPVQSQKEDLATR